MTTARQIAESRVIDAAVNRLAAKNAPAIRRVISKAMMDAADAFEMSGDSSHITIAIQRMTGPLSKAVEAAWYNSGRTIGKITSGKLKAHAKREYKEAAVDFGTAAVDFMKRKAGGRIVSIHGTTLDDVMRIVNQGFAEGASVGKIASGIRKIAPQLSRSRAEIIARTETHAGANAGSFAAADDIGVPMQKVWVAVEDDRTREEHRQADGQTVDMEKDFTVASEGLQFPGDPDGSAGNVIACRCACIYEAKD